MGPEIDPRTVLYSVSVIQYTVSLIITGVMLYLAKRCKRHETLQLIIFSFAIVTLVTAPWISVLNDAVIGAYPTIDKEGSLLFYLDGVHKRALLSPVDSLSDPAYCLIGFHLGHLWITEIFDIILSTHGAFNAQIILNLTLNITLSIVFLRIFSRDNLSTMVIGTIFGLQLHVFRDIHWYTIEKSSIYCLMSFWIMLEMIQLGKNKYWWTLGIIFYLITWINFYWGILSTILGICYGLKSLIAKDYNNNVLKGIATCIPFGLGVMTIQLTLMSNGELLAGKEEFLHRASLDTFDPFKLNWNRMSLWQSINPLIIGYGVWGLWRNRLSFLTILGMIFLFLSMGPFISIGIDNPLYLLINELPGLWRFAKPEIYFFVTYACFCIGAVKIDIPRIVLLLMLIFWVVGLFTSSAFPYLTVFIESSLSPTWQGL